MNYKTTVLMATFNRAQYITYALDSLISQTHPPHQIIVINDGSTDNTLEVLSNYSDKIQLINQSNAGKPTALNAATNHIKGDYVWIFDDDDIATPDALERHTQAFKDNHTIGFTYSSYYKCAIVDGNKIKSKRNVNTPNIEPDNFLIKLMEGNFLSMQAMLIKKDCYLNALPFDTNLIRTQDYDFVLRLAKQCSGVILQAPTYHLRVHDGERGTKNKKYSAAEMENHNYEYEKEIFKKIYRNFELTDYLPKTPNTSFNIEENTNRAILQRLSIFAQKGLWPFFIEDMRLLSKNIQPNTALDDEQRIITRRIMTNPVALVELLNNRQLLREYVEIINNCRFRKINIETSRGIYYTIRNKKNNINLKSYIKALHLIILLNFIARFPKNKF